MFWRRLVLCLALPLVVVWPAAAAADGPDLGYSKNLSWHVDDVPELAAMEGTVHAVLFEDHATYRGVDGQTIDGFYPGGTYEYLALANHTPFYFYGRDTATILPMARFYFNTPTLRSVVEEFLRLQYPDGSVSATVSPDFSVDKATVTSDEETSVILAAAVAYDASPEPAWLGQALRGQSLVERLNRAMTWVLSGRRDPETQLIKRAHTTDWGDVKWEPSDDPTHIQTGDQWTASIYDQAMGYAALRGLARLNAAAGRAPDAAHWDDEATALRSATDNVLWQDGRGFYRIHVHVTPDVIRHDFDEGAIVAIGNAAAVYYGLAGPDKVPRILSALEHAREEAGASKPGLTLEPPYTGWHQDQMDQRVYQNGAVWDWWGGRQISGEFWSGYSRLAFDHLMAVAQDWAGHPGRVREWESPWKRRTGVEEAYAGAAAVMGQAIIEGLFGVDFRGSEVRLTPRLGEHSGGIRVYQPAGDVYVAYEYQASDRFVALQYGSNSPRALSVRLPVTWVDPSVARLDGGDLLPIVFERTGQDLVAVLTVPSGTHRLEVFRLPRGREAL